MSTRTTFRRLAIALSIAACSAATGALGADDNDAAQAREEIGAELEELGTTLRAAVYSGTLAGEEAKEIFGRVARAVKTAYARDYGDGKDEIEQPPTAKGNVITLTVPKPEQVRALLQPEFLKRDLTLLRDELDLDDEQMLIAEMLFDDYLEAYDLATAPLREALAQNRRANVDAYIAFVLDDADVKLGAALDNARQADRAAAVTSTKEALVRIERQKVEGLTAATDEQLAQFEAWKQSVIAASSELDERLSAIRERTKRRLADMGRADATITTEDLIDLARQLRADRTQLRMDLTQSLQIIATDEQRGAENADFEAAMARVRIGRLLPQGRLGGESMNLWAALADTGRDETSRREQNEALAYAEAMLQTRTPAIAARLDERTNAAIDRELAGLELQSARAQLAAANDESIFEVDERRLDVVVRPYAQALRREVSASAATRDALLALLDESAAHIDATYPESGLSAAYRAAALRRGFPVETRRRWAERAVVAALRLEDLEPDVTEALLVLESDVATELQTLRSGAIAKRIQRDPKLARDFIAAEFDDADIDFDDDMWRELDYAAFAALDGRTEARLRVVLATEQLESLPARKRSYWDDAKSKGNGKPGGK